MKERGTAQLARRLTLLRLLVMGVSNKVSSFIDKKILFLLCLVSFIFASSSMFGEKVLRLGEGRGDYL